MMIYTKNSELLNKSLYLISSAILYIILYILISLKFNEFYNPVIGIVSLFIVFLLDLYFSKKKLRIFLRFIILFIIYNIIRLSLILLSNLASPEDTYNLFDKIPYIFFRDSIIIIFFLLYYFIFDSLRVKQQNRYLYYISTIVLIVCFFILFNFDTPIYKTIFKNYFNYSIILIIIVIFFIFRHISYYQNLISRKFEKKDFLLLFLLLIPIIFLLFIVTLQNHIDKSSKGNSGLFTENLFNFDFSNFIELKDEIKMSEDRVLIMELNGFNSNVNKRINEGWNRQIYLKRYSLEEYTNNGGFKVAEKYLDPNSPPIYISGYKWELKENIRLKYRTEILETLYLINIDASSLMGSELLTKVIPVTNWEGSPYKQIYKSYCYVFDESFDKLAYEQLTQNNFLNSLNPERKKLLLNWGTPKKEGRIKELAENITKQYDNIFYKVIAIQNYLLTNYYYSLKPGLAKSGNQLEYFLFESYKGYCSYFAFAMTLMLRSIGIASRVAVGFAPDMENKTLNFYDVRSIDGHAWVEVYFDNFGWITFDPTSNNFAPNETYDFSIGNKQERDDLIEEILKNKDKMKDIQKEMEEEKFTEKFLDSIKRSIQWIGVISFIFLVCFLIFLLYLKKIINILLYTFTNDIKKKIIYLYRHYLGILLDLNIYIKNNESIKEFAVRLKQNNIIDIENLTEKYQEALFHKNIDNISVNDIKTIKNKIDNQLKQIKLSRKIFAFFNITRLWKKILPVIFLLIVPLNFINTQNIDSNLDNLIKEANNLINSNYYDKALEILNLAEKKYPDSYKPNLYKARIYSSHSLYENAILEYLKTKNKGYISEEVFNELANAYGKIGEDKKALEQYLEYYNKLERNVYLYDNLGWMYFKVHEVNKGIEIINEGLKKYPNSSDLYMTLGTLYSESWNYELSKKYYLLSIEYSYKDYKSNSFRSIAYYNLALLEHSFLYYQNAYDSSKAAISLADRSSPHLELNYLYLGAMELKNSYKEINLASKMEPKTYFPQMSLSYVYIYAGRIDDAIDLIKNLNEAKDFSWMLYFGTNKNAYYAEINKNLSEAYQYKINLINFNEKNSFRNLITRPFRKIYYYILSILTNLRYTNLLIKIGDEKIKGGSQLEGLHCLFDAYEKIWASKAYKILKLAEKIELKINPKKERIYRIQENILKIKTNIFYPKYKIKNEILKNISLLDKRWEKKFLIDSLVELIKITTRKEKDKYIEELFSIHPPLLPMNNFKIKMNLKVNLKKINKSKLINNLKKRGFIFVKEGVRFSFEIYESENDLYISVLDNNQKKFSSKINLDNSLIYDIDNLSLEIFKKIFIIEL